MTTEKLLDSWRLAHEPTENSNEPFIFNCLLSARLIASWLIHYFHSCDGVFEDQYLAFCRLEEDWSGVE